MMIQSLVDYVLQRGNKDYGEFAARKQTVDPTSAVFNQRKMLEYLFKDADPSEQQGENSNKEKFYKKISDMKIQEISGQLNYFSQKMHAQFSRKHLNLDADMYKLQNEWLRKKIPDFYCYYFLKFSYANSYSRMHQLILSQIQNMSRQKDSYWIIRKTIEARQVCIINLRKQLNNLTDLDIEEGLTTLKEQNQLKKKVQREQSKNLQGFNLKNAKQVGEQSGKSWKNKLELAFQSISHLRKLSCYVVQLIKNWKSAIYNISQDPRRYRQRVIFYHHEANYLLKMLFDSDFVKGTILGKHFKFALHYDPFLIKPVMILQNKQGKTYNQNILFQLIKPSEQEMTKIVKSLIVLAQQQYDQDQQSRFINERKNYGELQIRKRMIQKKRDSLGIGHRQSSSKKISLNQQQSPNKKQNLIVQQKRVQFTQDKKASNTQNQLQQLKGQKQELAKKTAIMASLARAKKIRSVDLKKVSPYLSRNQHLKKAQQVIQMEHKFKVAHGQYLQTLKRNKSTTQLQNKNKQKSKVQQISQIIAKNKDLSDNKIFNKYIQENIRLMDEAKRKDYLYKNQVTTSPLRKKIQSSISYNKISFKDRKQAQYQRNLERYYHNTNNQGAKQSPSPNKKAPFNYGFPYQKKGTKPVIQISDRGIKSGQKIIEFQLTGKKGKNLGGILQNKQKLELSRTIQQKLSTNAPLQKQQNKNQTQQKSPLKEDKNLFESQQRPQIIVIRQEPQKIQQIKRHLYQQIKSQLLEELKKEAEDKEKNLNDMIEDQKRRKLNQIMEERRKQEQRRKIQEERMRLAQLQKERKKINLNIKIEDVQYAEENSFLWFDKIFDCNRNVFERLFTNQNSQRVRKDIQNQLYTIFLRGFHAQNEMAYCMVHYDWRQQNSRRLVINYLATKETYFYISTFHNICQFLWKNDPVDQIQIVMFNNEQNQEGKKVIIDVQEYANRNGEVYQKRLYSNIVQMKLIVFRPNHYKDLQFKYNKFYFGKKLNFKSQLLSSAVSLAQKHQPIIDMNLQVFTNYIFLLQELFRSYLTPQEIVQLRQNSTNIRRLKDIFRIVLQLQKNPPTVDELTIAQGLNLEDLYDKLKSKVQPPYDSYYWNNFYDKTKDNRILFAMLKTSLQLQYSLNTAKLNDKKYLRINTNGKLLTLRSSVYSKEQIYILNTDNPKIRIFMMQGQNYKLMRIQLFIFLNLVFNNIVEDTEKFVNSIWMPQFVINEQGGQKAVKRITDFSISMKKNFYLSEQIYFCNNQFIRSGLSLLPKGSDVIFRESMIFGMLHTQVQKGSTGMPIYAKLIDLKQYF